MSVHIEALKSEKWAKQNKSSLGRAAASNFLCRRRRRRVRLEEGYPPDFPATLPRFRRRFLEETAAVIVVTAVEPVGLERSRGQQRRNQSVVLIGLRRQEGAIVSLTLLLVLHTLPRCGPLGDLKRASVDLPIFNMVRGSGFKSSVHEQHKETNRGPLPGPSW